MTNDEMPSHHGVKVPPEERAHPNETLRLLIERGSCRNFSDEKIPKDVLELVLEAGIHAATGGNLQPYSIIKIEDQENRRKLGEWCEQPFIGRAPVLLLFCIDWRRLQRWARLEVAPFSATSAFRHFWISFQDTIICAQTICTAADAMGLGSVYIGTIIEFLPETREMLDLPEHVLPVVLLCLGYPKTRPQPRKKLGTGVIVHSERYHEIEDQALLEAFNAKYPGQKIQPTDERLQALSDVCREVHGEAFARQCLNKVQETGYITPVQRYFGLHYVANAMPKDNEAFLKHMEAFGFTWFKPYRPSDDAQKPIG